jgi:membrane-bound acyltransferase YfiQ involved in biofilm formation
MTAKTDTPRRREFVTLSVIMTFMVIYIHASSGAIAVYDKNSALYALAFVTNKLCGFVVPGFIFMSAVKYFMVFAHKASFSYALFLRGRLRKVVAPYVLWVVIYYLYFVSRDYFPFKPSDLPGYILYGNLSAPFYFVVIIMQFYILMPFWRVLAQTTGDRVGAAAVIAGSAVIMCVARALLTEYRYADRIFASYLFYWTAGIYCGAHYDGFLAFVKRRAAACFFAYAAVAGGHVFLCYLQSRGLFVYRYAEIAQAVFASVSIAAFFSVCALFAERLAHKIHALLLPLSDASYYIYLTHVLAILVTEQFAPIYFGASAKLVAKCVVAFTVPSAFSVLYCRLKATCRNIASRKKLGGISI